MTFRMNVRRNLLSACAELNAEDGHDPRYDRHEESSRVPNRKALQLCEQVAHALAEVLACCADDVLRDLMVDTVVPAPNTARLLVTVRTPADIDTGTALDHLDRARGLLRAEMARAIHRRKTPDLTFCVQA